MGRAVMMLAGLGWQKVLAVRGARGARDSSYSEACVRGRAEDGTAGPPAFVRLPAEAAGPLLAGSRLAGSRPAPEGRSAGAASDLMSMRQPVSLAASLAFWPSLPIASDSW